MITQQSAPPSTPVLTLRLGRRTCAVPLSHVAEVMRPLPVESLTGAPAGVIGVAIIRGRATPVVDLETLLGDGSTAKTDAARIVTLRLGDRAVALLVESVGGVQNLAGAEIESLPALWQGPHPPVVAALGAVDHKLLIVLEATRLLPDDWQPTEDDGGAG